MVIQIVNMVMRPATEGRHIIIFLTSIAISRAGSIFHETEIPLGIETGIPLQRADGNTAYQRTGFSHERMGVL
jgi:hypothetical protein